MTRPLWSLIASILFAGVLASSMAIAADEASRYYEDALVRYERKDDAGAIIQLKNALKADPGMLAAHLLMGRAGLRKGDYAIAEVALVEARRRGASRVEYVLPLGQVLLDLGRQKELLDSIQPSDLPLNLKLQVLMLRASAYIELSQFPQAREELDTARTLDSRSVPVVIMLSRLALQSGQRRDALGFAEQATKMDPADSGAWTALASLAYAEGKLPLALSHYERAVRLKNDNGEAQLGRGSILMDIGRIAEAKAVLEQLSKSDPKEPRGSYLRAVISAMEGKPDEARKLLTEVVSLIDPAPRGALTSRAHLLLIAGLSHYSLGATEKAKEYFELYVRFFPKQAGARKPLAAIYLAEGDSTRAMATLEPVLRSGARDPEVLALMASAYAATNRHQKASELLEEASRISDTPAMRTSLGLSLLGARQVDVGLEQLRKVLVRDPGQARASIVLALNALRDQQPKKAIEYLEAVLKRESSNLAALNLLGAALASAGDFAGARAAYEKAIAIDKSFETPQLNLAKLDAAERKLDQARQRLSALLASRASGSAARYELAMLDQRQHRTDDARRRLEELHEKDRSHLAGHLALIDLYLDAGALDKALALALESSPNRPGYLALQAALVRVQLARGDDSAARSTLASMTRLADFNSLAQYKISRLQVMAGNVAGARYSLEKALQGDSNFKPAKVALADLDLAEGAIGKVESRLAELLKSSPVPAEAYRLAGDLAATKAQWQPAIGHYRSALANGMGADVASRLYRAYTAAGQRKHGLAAVEALVRERPDDRALRLLLSDAQAVEGQLREAKATLEFLLKSGDTAFLLNNLANLQWQLKDAAALSSAEKAHKLAPDDPVVLDTLGWILAQSGKTEAGLRHLRDARLRNPSNPEIRYHLAWTLARSGKKSEALSELVEALALSDRFTGAEDALKLKAELTPQ